MNKSGNTRSPSVLDLFAGAGGFSLGFHEAGFSTLAAIDHNPQAVESLEVNFGHTGTQVFLRDLARYTPKLLRKELIRNKELSDLDVIIGGPPCQGWSKIGRAKLRSQKVDVGLAPIDSDPRNELYKSFLSFVRELQPKIAVIENVPGLMSYDGRNMADQISDDMSGCGYKVTWNVLNAADFGVPQNRQRVFFVGVRKGFGEPFQFPKPSLKSTPVTLRDAIGDLPRIQNGARDWIATYEAKSELSPYARRMRRGADQGKIFDHVCRLQNAQDVDAFKSMPQGGKYIDLAKKFKRYRDDIFEDKYHRLIWNQPSWCITAHLSKDCYSHIHPTQARTISIREAARIQSFPDSFYFAGAMGEKFQLIGNAVPPILAEKLAEAVKKQYFDIRPSSALGRAKPNSSRPINSHLGV